MEEGVLPGNIALMGKRALVYDGLTWFGSIGGGVALLYAIKELDKIQTSSDDEKIGVQIIKNALKVLTHLICVPHCSVTHDMFTILA